MRIAIVTEIAAPYRIPLFNALADRPETEVLALFLARRDPRRDYPFYRDEFAFSWRVLRGLQVRRGLRWVVVSGGVVRELSRFDPHLVIVGGWNQPAFWQALRWAHRHGTPSALWVESTARDDRSGSRSFAAVRRWALATASAILVPGRAAGEYARSLGVPGERIHVAPNAVDLGLFAERVDEERGRRADLRGELGLEGFVFLCVSRLSREKGVDVLARAAHDLPGTRLVLAGDGPEREAVAAAAPVDALLLGHVPREELPRWYAAADAFVMPSRSETWGMAMNEAAAAGLPLVASEAPGAAHELIDHGVNGFRVPVDDVDALHEALGRVAADPPWRERARTRTLELASGYTPAAWANDVLALARLLAHSTDSAAS